MVNWKWKTFEELGITELYQILQVRQEVFTMEQQCIYQDIDDLDQYSMHLLGLNYGGDLIAYLRVVEPGGKYDEPSIGRVLTRINLRGTGLGRELVAEGIKTTKHHYPGAKIRISAQFQLQSFYASAGFVAVGESYIEDGIPHIEMIYTAV